MITVNQLSDLLGPLKARRDEAQARLAKGFDSVEDASETIKQLAGIDREAHDAVKALLRKPKSDGASKPKAAKGSKKKGPGMPQTGG